MDNRNWLFDSYYTSLSPIKKDDELLLRWSTSHVKENILPYLPKNVDSEILEIGCGCGRNLKALQILGYKKSHGIDISREQIDYAINKMGMGNVCLEEPINFLSGKRGCYDIILMIDILEHLELEYSIKLLKLIRESLRDGGMLIIQVPNAMAPLSPCWHGDLTHLRAYSTLSMEQYLRLGGFLEIYHKEVTPLKGDSLISLLRKVIWHVLIKPVISAFMLVVYGNRLSMGRIYTADMLTIAYKNQIRNKGGMLY